MSKKQELAPIKYPKSPFNNNAKPSKDEVEFYLNTIEAIAQENNVRFEKALKEIRKCVKSKSFLHYMKQFLFNTMNVEQYNGKHANCCPLESWLTHLNNEKVV